MEMYVSPGTETRVGFFAVECLLKHVAHLVIRNYRAPYFPSCIKKIVVLGFKVTVRLMTMFKK